MTGWSLNLCRSQWDALPAPWTGECSWRNQVRPPKRRSSGWGLWGSGTSWVRDTGGIIPQTTGFLVNSRKEMAGLIDPEHLCRTGFAPSEGTGLPSTEQDRASRLLSLSGPGCQGSVGLSPPPHTEPLTPEGKSQGGGSAMEKNQVPELVLSQGHPLKRLPQA